MNTAHEGLGPAVGYLPAGLPRPQPAADALTQPYWEGLMQGQLRVQHCQSCGAWQFGPEWLCHRCHQFDPAWETVAAEGRIYSWERVWYAANPVLADHLPYLVVLVALPHAGGVRMVGNLLGDPGQRVTIGAPVQGVFEHHRQAEPPYSLLQWQAL